MIPREHSSLLWVAPDAPGEGTGTFENPFATIARALGKARPGHTVVLKNGRYMENLTVQNSGEFDTPLRITADDHAEVVIAESTWFFYDTCDLILSQLSFRHSPHIAISVIGKCLRNRFEFLRFTDCGTAPDSSCTFFFGGSGASCNVVESCRFERSREFGGGSSGKFASIGLMISEGDADGGEPNTDHLLRRNTFSNCNYGILAGARDSTVGGYGHILEENYFTHCSDNGIMVKCGDTQVRGNVLEDCPSSAISIMAGRGSLIENNRIVNSPVGIVVYGSGHSVQNNCFVRCTRRAIHVSKKDKPELTSASNIFIEGNTCIECGEPQRHAALRIDAGTSCIVVRNLFCGAAAPYELEETQGIEQVTGKKSTRPSQRHVIENNIVCNGTEAMSGCIRADMQFNSQESGNYENSSGYGATGAVLTPGFVVSDPPEQPSIFAPLPVVEHAEEEDAPPGPPDSKGENEPDDEVKKKMMFY